MSSKNKNLFNLVLSAMFLALALVLPLLTGQLQSIGNALCPMHIPVILCGFFCGPIWGLLVGFIAPLLRFVIFGMPPIMPIGFAMAFELATYGFMTGLLYKLLPKNTRVKHIVTIYASLIIAMIAGRLVWGVVRAVIAGVTSAEFGMEAFLAGAFLNAIPGIILQIILIPVLVMAIKKAYKNQ